MPADDFGMALKQMPLLFAGVCRECSIELAAKTVAFYDLADKTVVCQSCRGPEEHHDPLAFLDAPPPIEAVVAQIRQADATTVMTGPEHGHGADGKRGRLPSIGRRRAEPAAAAIDPERAIGAMLDRELGVGAAVLHHRQAPNTRGLIDHVVIAPSGVWVIDTDPHDGKVDRRELGSKHLRDDRLFVNGTDQTELVTGLTWQVSAVRAALDPIHLGESPIHPVLVFPAADIGWFAKPFDIAGVRITWGKHLIDAIGQPGPLDEASVRAITIQLNLKLATRR